MFVLGVLFYKMKVKSGRNKINLSFYDEQQSHDLKIKYYLK